ncbi:centromere protein W [Lepisosteus oculatus]|uniref:Centromere protein W n=1 Tax=Lepisosteus oculatus TaxID=7918 RepID=W5NIE3_LEPOC|nr:PREDICTED: centromere protein W [Lepisosteus oculatus]
MLKKISRNNLKSILKKKPNVRFGANADLMVHLNLLLFLHRLAEESRAKAFEDKTATIKPLHVKAVSKNLLKKARG